MSSGYHKFILLYSYLLVSSGGKICSDALLHIIFIHIWTYFVKTECACIFFSVV